MYEKLYNMPEPTDSDLARVEEIKFYMLVYKLIAIYKEPAIIVDVFDALSRLLDCNPLHISQLVLVCFKKDPAYAPSQREVHALLYKIHLPVRSITSMTKVSNQTLYEDVKKYIADPYPSRVRLNTAQTATLQKFMKQLEKLSKVLKVW